MIYSCCFSPSTVIPHFYTFYFPAWEKVCWVHIFSLYIWVRQLVVSSLQMKYLVICEIINPEILFFPHIKLCILQLICDLNSVAATRISNTYRCAHSTMSV